MRFLLLISILCLSVSGKESSSSLKVVVSAGNQPKTKTNTNTNTNKIKNTKNIYPDYYTYTSFPISGKQEKRLFSFPSLRVGSLDWLQVFSKIGSVGGWLFIGLQLYNHLKHFVIKSEGQAENGSSATSVLTSIQKLEKDYEELWRICHNLHKTQSERLEETEVHLNELRSLVKEQQQQQLNVISKAIGSINEISVGVTGALERLDKIESHTSGLELNLSKDIDTLKSTLSTTLTAQDVEAIVKTKLQSVESEVQKMREVELPTALREHDEIVLQKLKKFGDSIHKLVQIKLQTTANAKKTKK